MLLSLIRIDSCRKCGKELQVTQLCSNCDQPLHFEYNNCNTFVDNPIHQHESITSQSLLLGKSTIYSNYNLHLCKQQKLIQELPMK